MSNDTSLIKATVVIPAYNRRSLLDRAIASVLKQQGAEFVEIIVVDDGSDFKYRSSLLREGDIVVYNDRNLGAAVSRNIGIKKAKGDWIFLLDSDDEYLDVDFLALDGLEPDFLYYSNIEVDGRVSYYPETLSATGFISAVLREYPFVGQTSSLFFNKKSGLLFDESLPKHQDWDFVLFQAILSGIVVKKSKFLTRFDREDRASLSRVVNFSASDYWYQKILSCSDVTREDLALFEYVFFHPSVDRVSWGRFFKASCFYVFKYGMWFDCFKVLYKRLFLK